jgi:putative transposase
VLPIAPSTYYEHAAKRADPIRLSARARRDDALMPEVQRVFEENFRVYGVRKVWRQLKREGHDVARCTVARLMQTIGLQGVIRGKQVRTTISDKAMPCPLDLARRLLGERPQRRLTISFYQPTHTVLRRPLESAQYVSIKYTERLAEAGVEPSVGSVGDSYDNALAETINGLYKAEVIHRRGPWRSFEAVEFATLEWVDWFK